MPHIQSALSATILCELTCQIFTKPWEEFHSLLVTDGETEARCDTVTCSKSELECRQPNCNVWALDPLKW